MPNYKTMFKNNPTSKKVVVQGKKGSYNIPVKFLKQQPVKQEKLYKEYWE